MKNSNNDPKSEAQQNSPNEDSSNRHLKHPQAGATEDAGLFSTCEAAGSSETPYPSQIFHVAEANWPTEIGPYRLSQKIGEGGMGIVWQAEQSEPVQRTVALKIIKPQFLSGETLNRFQLERKTLAMMEHPNIARIIDAGKTENGLPYFVMEWVDGQPITQYCDSKCLTIEQRLELFIQVCAGVQHAHQKGIIHRDLKPSNILVAEVDGKPVPKVIDFGLAKETANGVTQRASDLTQVGQVLGTLKYMSPEQAGLNDDDIDTRSDIYSLGVILYELLTSQTPIDNALLKNEAVFNLLHVIRDRETVKPSSQLSATDINVTKSIARCRCTDLSRLQRILAGDLDWITMKALEKPRSRRYESANGFSQDLERYLAGNPVHARPPSVYYVSKKFISKYRVSVGIAALLLLSLIAGITGTTMAMLKAIESEALAEKRLNQRKIARKEAYSAQTGQEELRKLEAEYRVNIAKLESQNSKLSNLAMTLTQSLTASRREPTCVLRDQAMAYNLKENLKQFKKAEFAEVRDNVNLKICLAQLLRSYNQNELGNAVLSEALAESINSGGEDYWLTREVEVHIALYQVIDGHHDEGIAKLQEILKYNKANRPDDTYLLLIDMSALATAYKSANRKADELKLRQEMIEVADNGYYPYRQKKNRLKISYAICLEQNDMPTEAIRVYRDLLAGYDLRPAEEPADRLVCQSNLGSLLLKVGQLTEAISLFEDVLAQSNSTRFNSTRKELAIAYQQLNGTTSQVDQLNTLTESEHSPDHMP